MREIVEPTLDEHGDETHPAWVVVGAHRSTAGPVGAVLFDSEIRNHHVVTVRVSAASRKRHLHRDWIHERKPILEFTMSEAQWAALVSSMNSGSGVPATLGLRDGDWNVPGMPFAPRLQESMDEVSHAATHASEEVAAALAAYKEKKSADNLRSLEAAINNLPANITFAAQSLTEHAEGVVQKIKADVEAFAVDKARSLGLSPGDITGPLELLAGDPDEHVEVPGEDYPVVDERDLMDDSELEREFLG